MDYEKFLDSMEKLEKPETEVDLLFPLLCKFVEGWTDPEEFMNQFTLTDLLGIGNNFAALMKLHESTRGMSGQVLQAIDACPAVTQRRLL